MKIFGLAGWSGSGKTTLMVKLLPELTRRGLSVSTMKHAHHDFDIDQPGKDSYEHRAAGAKEVLVASLNRWALVHEHWGVPEPPFEDLLRHLTPVDLLLVEGFKQYPLDKIEVYRAGSGKPMLCQQDSNVVAVASDAAIPGLKIPVIDVNDVPAVADFIIAHCGLKGA
ncbi:MAG: molybdopterin-guanine dinucleotide biosynthesis protein B [Alphaproteobacteria bacterium]